MISRAFVALGLLTAAKVVGAPIEREAQIFRQNAATWQPILIDNNTAPEVKRAFEAAPRYTGGAESDTLLFPSDTASLTEAVWSSAVAPSHNASDAPSAPEPALPRCATVRIAATYTVEYFPTTSDFGGPGLYHKLLLSDDAETQRWPSGLAFAFGGGTSPLVARRVGYDYKTPVAFVYAHSGNNTCMAEVNQRCAVYTSTESRGRTVAGNYSVELAALLDTRTGALTPQLYVVAMRNETYTGTLFNISSFGGPEPQPVVATRWLNSMAPVGARIYFMVRRRTHLALRNLLVSTKETCAEPVTTTTTSTTTTADAAAVTIATEASITLPQAGTTLLSAGESVPQVDGETADPTVYVFIAVACALVCIIVAGLLCVFRRRIRMRWSAWRNRREIGSMSDDNDEANRLEPARSQYSALPIAAHQTRENGTYGDLGEQNHQVIYQNGVAVAQAPASSTYDQFVSRIRNTLRGDRRAAPVYDRALPHSSASSIVEDVDMSSSESGGASGSGAKGGAYQRKAAAAAQSQYTAAPLKKPANHYDAPSSTLKF
jgi:hypothetical protein